MEITYIKTENLFRHPNNPRTEYNDIEELTKSVRKNGIFQPLTVVRMNEHIERYNVVAGNRRLEAARAAGLEECPCIISDMTEAEQAALMLTENMIRKSLNPYEECKGVQMCLDLGMSESDIAKKTGLSKKTISHRKKMAELDQKKLAEVCRNNQITVQELISLEKIKDVDKRNEVLEAAGTNNFNYRLESAVRREKNEEERKAVYEKLINFAEEMPADWRDNAYYQCEYHVTPDFEIPDDKDEANYRFKLAWEGSNWYALYKERPDIEDEDEPEESEYEKNRARQEKRKKQLAELGKTFYEMRKEFMKTHTEFHGNAVQWLTYLLLADDFSDEEKDRLNKPEGFPWKSIWDDRLDYELYAALMGDEDIADEYTAEDVVGDMAKARTIDHGNAVAVIYSFLECGDQIECANYMGAFDSDDEIYPRLYAFMEQCGYELSDAEKQILDGTHEFYYKGDD